MANNISLSREKDGFLCRKKDRSATFIFINNSGPAIVYAGFFYFRAAGRKRLM